MRTIVVIAAVFLLGCAGPGTKMVVDPSAAKTFSITRITDSQKTTQKLEEENQRLLETKLEEVLNFCLPRLSGYERKSEDQATKAYWLSMSGLLAGTVAVPALAAASAGANAGWIAGLGGWG